MSEEYGEGYGEGYAAGKANAHTEIRNNRWAGHVEGCKCEPCITVAVVLEAHYQAEHDKWLAKTNVHLPDLRHIGRDTTNQRITKKGSQSPPARIAEN